MASSTTRQRNRKTPSSSEQNVSGPKRRRRRSDPPPVPGSSLARSLARTSDKALAQGKQRHRSSDRPPQRPASSPPIFWRSLLGFIAAGASAAGVIWFEHQLPNTQNIRQATWVRPGTVTYQSSEGDILYQSGESTRQTVTGTEIPKQLKEAFLATEDRRFYDHDGVDLKGVIRATLTNFRSGELAEGGSTLTQQLARISFLSQERSIIRKLKEARIAQKIEASLSKDEILERYLNQVYLGSGAYGVADAAQVYYSKTPSDLTLPEMALLAGLPAAPSIYSPLDNPEIALKRRNVVLLRMQQAQYITPEEAKAAQGAPLNLNPQNPPNQENQAPYFTAYLQKELLAVVPKAQLQQGGLVVETTLNQGWQEAAAQTITETVNLQGWGQRFDQGALIAIDPKTGAIKSMVGGVDFQNSQFNRATQAQRQPGSTFKPFVYTTAIAAGLSPTNGYLDAPISVDGYRPKNYSGEYKGWVSMTSALAHSYNIPAVRVLLDVGFQPTIKMARALGIESDLAPVYSTALGSSEVTLLELTNAYATLASQGLYHQPHGIQKVINRHGEILYERPIQAKRALDADSAAIMTWMLEQVVSSGTGVNAKLDRPVAGKTGTSEDSRDLWFIGYIPQLVTGIWLGNDDNAPTQGTSATAAASWQTYMQSVVQSLPVEPFPKVPRFEGRQGSIKVAPIQPKDLRTEAIPSQDKPSEADSTEAALEN
ncbi:transglycosylase domain-containing protein [Lyngbya confervoides]|uniref:Penicillin-binding protein 1A n=1 Tax=Lyngbya confervoides BDU141951 TaxID=1574623 RepID=A0ABD4T7I2_9CYAN|nr:penicillin-binding protein 1A [Lyngbya confervoides]MCM1984737.1 penicillin-binding protein 1A [Lyngbya confervoides BDU141951]